MNLHLYDTDQANPLAATVRNLDYDYQAEQWVQDSAKDPRSQGTHWVVKWELHDGVGLRARWERPDQDPGLPKLVAVSTYWTGEWKVGT